MEFLIMGFFCVNSNDKIIEFQYLCFLLNIVTGKIFIIFYAVKKW